MCGERILITGAAGFVGRHMLAAVRAAFADAEVLPTAHGGEPACHPLDVTDAHAVAALIAAFRPTACIHLAAIAVVPMAGDDPATAWRVNLHGTLHLAEAIQQHARGCLFLFASSAEIYGRSFAPGLPLDEGAVPAPMNLYGATKAAADLALGVLAGPALHVVRLRAFNHTGAGQADSFVVAAFARQIARIAAGQQPPRISVGSLAPARDFLDVRDVCAAYVACLRRRAVLAPGAILNLASGTPRRIGAILDDLLAMAGVTAEIAVAPDRLRGPEIMVACGAGGLARRLLDWRPQVAWPDTLAAVLADWRARIAAG